jgi:hypothetical protein
MKDSGAFVPVQRHLIVLPSQTADYKNYGFEP